MYPIGPVSGATLYEILARQVLARGDRAHRPIPYYIMTSHATHDETVAFFNDNQFFGLNPKDVTFFKQGRLPAVDRGTGAVLLSNPGEIALSPDGHGGLLAAMHRHGVIDDLQRRGVSHLFYHQVDNPLVKVCEPEFIGAHAMRQSQVSTKVVPKTGAAERMGLLVEVEGRGRIIEYSDFPADRAAETEPDGSLRFWAGSTAIHLFDVAFLSRLVSENVDLPLHRAIKRVPYFDPVSKKAVQPTEENALKYERFIFDIIPLAERSLVVEADREQEFYPLKNASGEFSPETVRARMVQVYRGWLSRIGVQVDPGVAVEITPRLAMSAADLGQWKSRLPDRISKPIQLTLSDDARQSGESWVHRVPIGDATQAVDVESRRELG
jgi:UDP-N-acetylglucosamine/UDP-N-acetylgalactosamine diphosphorylase